ncbi:unnamed protein product [Urochloa humidicola]
MGKCVRIRSSSKPPAPGEAAAAAYLTLRSGRRVPPAACSRPSRRHRRGSCTSCRCGGAKQAAAKQRACGSGPGRRKSAEPRQLASGGDRLPEEESPVARDVDGSFETKTSSGDDVVKREQGSKKKGQPSPLSPQLEAEMEAFFAAAELAERQRFVEVYNYDVALDRPLEGRFEWTPVST